MAMAENSSQNYTNGKQATRERAAEMLANPEITTDKEIYESLDICKATFYNWKNEQEFIDIVNEKVSKYTDKALPDVWEALINEATGGNTNAIKLYFEMKDKYRDRKEISGPDGGPIEVDPKEALAREINKIAGREED